MPTIADVDVFQQAVDPKLTGELELASLLPAALKLLHVWCPLGDVFARGRTFFFCLACDQDSWSRGHDER
jgi:hypothetical protein